MSLRLTHIVHRSFLTWFTLADKTIRAMGSTSPSRKAPINLAVGWPSASLLPPLRLESAAHSVLSNPQIAAESLNYGILEGYLPLREEIAKWLTAFYTPKDPITYDRIVISGGASQMFGGSKK